MEDEKKELHPADIELPRDNQVPEAPKQLLPICPMCGADPLLPIARQVNLPFTRGGPPIMFVIVYCGQCRKPLPAADFVCLGIPEGAPSPIALPKGFRQ